jgi:putative membrane protein
MMEHLASLNGADFDKACGLHAVEAHEKAIKLFRAEAQSGQDPDLKAFAQKTLPTLEDHLRMARQLSKSSKED